MCHVLACSPPPPGLLGFSSVSPVINAQPPPLLFIIPGALQVATATATATATVLQQQQKVKKSHSAGSSAAAASSASSSAAASAPAKPPAVRCPPGGSWAWGSGLHLWTWVEFKV